jgi:hypothetical protein
VTEAPVLLSSEDVLAAARAIDDTLSYATLHRWVRYGAVVPTRPPAGTGSQIGWSTGDAAALRAIARVRADLATLGLPCPWRLVGELWEQLITTGTAGLHAGTVTVHVTTAPHTDSDRLGLEDE